MKRILILSVFPAPYRAKLFDRIKQYYNAEVYFERDNDDNRSSEWFVNGKFSILNTKSAKKSFRKAITRIKRFDLVALYDYTSPRSILLILLCIVLNVKFTVNCDGVIFGKKQNAASKLIKTLLLPHASACFASGEYAKKYFLSYGVKEEKIYIHNFTTLEKKDILENPVPKEEKDILKSNFGIPNGAIVYIAIGRFIALKNYRWLLSNWPQDSKCFLLLIGGGEEMEEYEKIIKDRRLNNARVFGYMPKADILSHLRMADFFIHPTTYDAWGLVINEALSQGIPCLVSNKCVAGLELIKRDYNGMVFDYKVDSVPCILEESEKMLNLIGENLGKNALDTVRDYTYDEMAKTHLKVFGTLLGSN